MGRWSVVLVAMLGACGGADGDDEGGDGGGSIEDGLRLSGKDVEAFGDIEVDEVMIRGDFVYAKVTNQGSRGNLFKVGFDFLDRSGEVMDDTSTHCMSERGGPTVLAGEAAHCFFRSYLDAAPASVQVGYVSIEEAHDFAPTGLYTIDGDPTFGEEGSSFGWARATVCRQDGVSDIHDTPSVELYVFDQDGFPWDEGSDSPRMDSACVIAEAGDLNMPEDPVVIAIP